MTRKNGLLLLRQYMYERTDEQHPVSVTDILVFWQQHGIQAEQLNHRIYMGGTTKPENESN